MARKARAVETPQVDQPAQVDSTQEAASAVSVRVLVACSLGRANDVVELDQAAVIAAQQAGLIDPNPDAVAAAAVLR